MISGDVYLFSAMPWSLLNLAHLKNHLSPHANMSTRVLGYWSKRHLTPNWGCIGHLLLSWHWVNLSPSSITEKFSLSPIPGTSTDVGVIVCMFFYFLNFTVAHVAAGGAGSKSVAVTFCNCCLPLHFRFVLHFCQSFALYYLFMYFTCNYNTHESFILVHCMFV